MFVLREENTFTWPVDVKVPKEGKFAVYRFQATFRMMPRDRAVEMTTGADADEAERNFLPEIFIGWSDVKDEEGNDIAFSDEARDRLLDNPIVRVALAEAYSHAITGRRLAIKN